MNEIPIEHLYILGVVLIFMLAICIAIWHVRNVDIEKDNLESYQDYMDERRSKHESR